MGDPKIFERLTQKDRLDRANELILVIASVGLAFFRNESRVAYLELDPRGRVWFVDHYTEARIYTHYPHRWTKFSSGGTLKRLVESLRDYVKKGVFVRGLGGDLWGYGADMDKVRAAAGRLGMTNAPTKRGPE